MKFADLRQGLVGCPDPSPSFIPTIDPSMSQYDIYIEKILPDAPKVVRRSVWFGALYPVDRMKVGLVKQLGTGQSSQSHGFVGPFSWPVQQAWSPACPVL